MHHLTDVTFLTHVGNNIIMEQDLFFDFLIDSEKINIIAEIWENFLFYIDNYINITVQNWFKK